LKILLVLRKKFLTATVEMTEQDNKYWTSGSNAGVGCEETWGWCNTNTLFKTPFTMWKAGAPAAPRRQNCAQLHLQTNVALVGLEDVACTAEPILKITLYKFEIVQSALPLTPCTKPNCPYACTMDAAKNSLATQWKGAIQKLSFNTIIKFSYN
jgi:hypothetical protein